MQLAEIKKSLCSVVAIPVTPYDDNGALDFDVYRNIVSHMVDSGISVITPNGNTGEFYALSPQECRQAVEAAVSGADNKALVLAGVGFDTSTAIEMATFAEEAGAGAVMIHQPVHPFRSPQGWVAYHRTIADACPNLGIVPYIRDTIVDTSMLRELANNCPNFVGIKYAVSNPLPFTEIVRRVGADRLAWICGLAEGWAPFFWVGGAQGFTSGLVNVKPDYSLKMLSCLETGDQAGAMEIWSKIKPFEDLRARRQNANNVPAVKEAMAQIGLCNRSVRPPISELPDEEKTEVASILATWSP